MPRHDTERFDLADAEKRDHPGIPTGFWPTAQGCEARATLGGRDNQIINPNGVVTSMPPESGGRACHNPVGVVNVSTTFSQGSSSLATLGFVSQSLWDCPQLTFTQNL